MKYQITITEKDEYETNGQKFERDITVYTQRVDDVDVAAVIAVINKKPEPAKE
jgi:hypothetical protein